jgi:protoporphyrinogen/coproporphyrinogen III oxidase
VPERKDAPVAVVGGGIAGLAAAFSLHRRQEPFVLFEAGPRWGGVIRSERVDGFLLEGGPDAILTQKPDAVALCRELGLGDRLVPTNPDVRTVYVLRRGRLYPLPDGMVLGVPTRFLPLAKSRLFSLAGKARMGLELLLPPRREDGDESIASFVRRRLGEEALQRLGEPLLAGIHAGDPERLSMRATFPRFVEIEKGQGSLIRSFWKARRRAGPAPSAAFVSLADGLSELTNALVAALPGGALRSNTAVRSVVRCGEGFGLELHDGGRVSARAVVLAVPPGRAAVLLRELLPGLAGRLEAFRAVSTATILLGYRRADVRHPLDGYGLIVPRSEGLRCSACGFFSTKFPGRAPEGHVLIRAFMGGARHPEVLEADDATLVATAQRELAPVLGLTGEPVVRRVYRWPLGTPQMEVGHLDAVREVERLLAATPGLALTGAGLRVTGIPDCIADARRAVEAVGAGAAVSGSPARAGS